MVLPKLIAVCLCALTLVSGTVVAQELTSDNYKIVDPTVDSGGGVSESTSYSFLSSIGNPTADARLTSGSYAVGSGFPNGIQANVPVVRCAETDTTDVDTDCVDFPNAFGAQGECGTPGCYDRAKIEIDGQGNPADTLYLVQLVNNTTSQTYYVNSSHMLTQSPTFSDYMTICAFQGKDTNDGGCVEDATYQSTNVFGLQSGANYTVAVRALHGDFTESQFGPGVSFTTEEPSVNLDIDIGTTSAASTSEPYSVDLGSLAPGTPKIATNRIWLDLNTNAASGLTAYVSSANQGLDSGAAIIPSQAEDLDVDGGDDGGYGLKVQSTTETRLGPLLADTNYDTTNVHEVGDLTTVAQEIFSTEDSGGNRGPVVGGRAGIQVLALSQLTTATGAYSDTLTFSVIGAF